MTDIWPDNARERAAMAGQNILSVNVWHLLSFNVFSVRVGTELMVALPVSWLGTTTDTTTTTTSAMFKVPVGPRTRTSWTTIVTIHRNRHQPIVKVESVRVRGCRARHRARGHGGDDPGPAQHHSPQSEMFFFLVGARFNGQVPSYGDMMGPTLTHVVTWDNNLGTPIFKHHFKLNQEKYLLIANSMSLAIKSFSYFSSILSRQLNTLYSDNKLVYWSKDNKQHILEMTHKTFWLTNIIR